MYLRHSKIKKNGKTHTYWRLVPPNRPDPSARKHLMRFSIPCAVLWILEPKAPNGATCTNARIENVDK